MSLIATAKNKTAKGSISTAFKNEAGAIDLASIMVGIIVIGLIGGVIAATVFSVIPWAQDNAAKQQLDSVAAAQSAYIGLSSDGKASTFGGAAVDLKNTGTAPATNWSTSTLPATTGTAPNVASRLAIGNDGTVVQTLFAAPSGTKLATGFYGSGTDAHYVAAVKSASGARFYITDTKTQATLYSGTLSATTTASGATEVATAKANAAVNAAAAAVI